MKKLVKSILMLSIASLAILSSCKDDDTTVTDVSVEVSSTPASPVTVGTPFKITLTAKGNTDNKLKNITVTRSSAGMTDQNMLSKNLSGTSATEEFMDTLWVEGTYNYTVAVNGEKGTPATKTFSMVVNPTPGPLVATANAVPLFAQNNDPGNNANFMSLKGSSFTTFSTNTFAANKANVDLAFFFGTQNKATLTSPSDATMQGLYSGLDWTGVNTTQLYKTSLTVAQYDDIADDANDAALLALTANVTWTSSVNLLTSGNVILFKTGGATPRYGLIKVSNVSGTTSTDGQIDLSVVVQDK